MVTLERQLMAPILQQGLRYRDDDLEEGEIPEYESHDDTPLEKVQPVVTETTAVKPDTGNQTVHENPRLRRVESYVNSVTLDATCKSVDDACDRLHEALRTLNGLSAAELENELAASLASKIVEKIRTVHCVYTATGSPFRVYQRLTKLAVFFTEELFTTKQLEDLKTLVYDYVPFDGDMHEDVRPPPVMNNETLLAEGDVPSPTPPRGDIKNRYSGFDVPSPTPSGDDLKNRYGDDDLSPTPPGFDENRYGGHDVPSPTPPGFDENRYGGKDFPSPTPPGFDYGGYDVPSPTPSDEDQKNQYGQNVVIPGVTKPDEEQARLDRKRDRSELENVGNEKRSKLDKPSPPSGGWLDADDDADDVTQGTKKSGGFLEVDEVEELSPEMEDHIKRLTDDEKVVFFEERRRRMEEQERMFKARKLCLVLDLDHTLLNSAKFCEVEPMWESNLRAIEANEKIRETAQNAPRRELYRSVYMSMWTKLRPGIWRFLKRTSELFVLHLYTMGNKAYATEMAKLLDPTGVLFAGRVISKGDDGVAAYGDDKIPKSKDLDGVLGMDSGVLIIDDSSRVWPHHLENLITVERYIYFPCTRKQFNLQGPSLLEAKQDEREADGILSSILAVLERVHFEFYRAPSPSDGDSRLILADVRRSILAGCKIVFSRIFPVEETQPQLNYYWVMAERYGATCTLRLEDDVTHVVAPSLGTEKCTWAIARGKHVVRPGWLEASSVLYRRANERDFHCN